MIEDPPDAKFTSMLFLPPNPKRASEGGLRTKRYFKQSLPDKPLITVITVVFNCAKTLEDTIKSVVNQTYDNVEYIIIDGGSTDGTVDIIRKYEEQIDYWVSEPDDGIYYAMNKGILLSKGSLIGILNAGDTYEPDSIRLLVKKYDQSHVSGIYYGDGVYHHTDLGVKTSVKASVPRLIHSMSISHQSIFISEDIYRSYGLYDMKYRYAADYAYLLKLFLDGRTFVYVGGGIACFATGGASDVNIIRSRIESLFAQFELNAPKKYLSVLLYIREVVYLYTYNILTLIFGKRLASSLRKKRILKRSVPAV